MIRRQRTPASRAGPWLTALTLTALSATTAAAQSGHIINGAGAENQAVAGVATGMPLEPSGSITWNSAGIAFLEDREVSLSLGLFSPRSSVRSSVAAPAFLGGTTGRPLSGRTHSDRRDQVLTAFSFVHHGEDAPWSVGLGLHTAAVFAAEYPADASNPITGPQRPNGVGFGALSSEYRLMQLTPTFAWRFNDALSIGFAPVLNYATLELSPNFYAPPDDANGDGFANPPGGTASDEAWGAGFQVGVMFRTTAGIDLGASFKSPQWCEEFHFNGEDETGRARSSRVRLDVPMIVSLGLGCRAIERVRFGVDVRYIDYENTRGFESARPRANGELKGLGWKSVWVLSTGIRVEPIEDLFLSAGYAWSSRAVRDPDAYANVATPAVIEHQLSGGIAWECCDDLTFAVSGVYGFRNTASGPFRTPAGSVPGTQLRSTAQNWSVSFSLRFEFGDDDDRDEDDDNDRDD